MTTPHTDEEQLEPCPCCRAIPQTHCDYKCFDRGSTPGWQVRCDNCGLQTCWWHSLADAIEKWSKRISPASAAPTVRAKKTILAPSIICLCGSARFADEFIRQYQALTEDGYIALLPCIPMRVGMEETAPTLKARLDALHLCKIDLADEVLVLNIKGYVGPSTRNEIAYAIQSGKRVRYLEPQRNQREQCGTPAATTAAPQIERGTDTNFPLSETLRLLVEWAQHLHDSHECDCDGWEQRSFLIEAAQRYQTEIAQVSATAAPVEQTKYEQMLTTNWLETNARRIMLITAKRVRALSETEIADLEELQWLAGIRQQLMAGPDGQGER